MRDEMTEEWGEDWEEEPDDDHREDGDQDDDELGDTWPCPYCKSEIYEEAQRCPVCEQYILESDRTSGIRHPLWVKLTVLLLLLLFVVSLVASVL